MAVSERIPGFLFKYQGITDFIATKSYPLKTAQGASYNELGPVV
jgi:hypothetical protein